MILYIDPKNATRKLLKLINEFGKSAEYKINTQKSVAFLYINNKRSEREIQEAVPFTIASKRMKIQNTAFSLRAFATAGKFGLCLHWVVTLHRKLVND